MLVDEDVFDLVGRMMETNEFDIFKDMLMIMLERKTRNEQD